MATISIIRVENPAEKEEISARILHALPDWFGLPDSTQKYIDDSRSMPFFAAVREGQAVGFAALKATSPCAGEIYVMGVLPEYHRSGIGQQLFAAIRAEAIARGYRLLQVKPCRRGITRSMTARTPFTSAWAFCRWSACRRCGMNGIRVRCMCCRCKTRNFSCQKEGISAFCGEYIKISAEKEATLWLILARQSKKSGNRA